MQTIVFKGAYYKFDCKIIVVAPGVEINLPYSIGTLYLRV